MDAVSYVATHFVTFTLPLTLGIIILILTLRRWITRRDK